MALAGPAFVGSGEFVPVRVWSCPTHEQPVEHWCDCDRCDWVEPDCCAAADWVDALDAAGNVVVRELSVMEVQFRSWFREEPTASLADLLKKGAATKYEWVEDQMLPRFTQEAA